jgi:hypothetical protein
VAPLSTVFLPPVEGSLLVCTCLVSSWHKLLAFTHFLDDEYDTTQECRGFSVSNKKTNCELWIKLISTYNF